MSEIFQISNEKASQVYKDVQGPARRQQSKGSGAEDFRIICDILETCGVKLIEIDQDVSASVSLVRHEKHFDCNNRDLTNFWPSLKPKHQGMAQSSNLCSRPRSAKDFRR